MDYKNLDETGAYAKLLSRVPAGKPYDIAPLLDERRVASCLLPMAGGLSYSWAAKAVNTPELELLQALSDEQDLIGKYRLLLDGEIMNPGEGRKVLHHLLRGQLGKPVIYEGKDLGEFYARELERFSVFADLVRNGKILGSTGKSFEYAVQIGIGGSDLGPRALYLALENWAVAAGRKKLSARFISNVDPDDGAQVAASVDLERTLFILVSKSGTTQETLANELFIKGKLKKAGLDPSKHMVAVTSETSPLAHNPDYLDSFYIDDFIGGRYSSTSAVGGVILSLALGRETFAELLEGAHETDKSALENDIMKNPALLDALIGVWERNFLGFPSTAVLPYSQALSRFPAHLQQLDMESNGKRVNRRGEALDYATGPVVFGEPGTNGQHSFYQLLHQGTDIVPLQFIGFLESQLGDDVEVDGSVSQTKLKANLAAQIVAFAKGKADPNGNKSFPGGRPSSLICGKKLDPRALGALLAHFENKVMFQGFVWNLNSFDQEGVQLGKVLTKQVLSGQSGDSALDAYSKLLGIL
ncbi:glucose-6-phosphate isomerase [Breznakiella homolactica]|uniref:Glucose-6-phosphate isomerase n=1 Tax=Breznakiella homolactica TaxID=2798577 RepID=A0A7T7XLN7_9SPIR|nr:glucose-6-phosphate isomerase [Breznakiella homolactica]QQO08590.1 glucose-6-phosphate isomerase [Breznakiella homolactica]